MQELVFEADGNLSFKLDEQPVLGMGEGGPRPERGTPWREQPVQFDRRGALDTMEPRWQSDMYGSRNPVAMLLGTGGWGLFVADAVGAGRSARRRARRVHAVEADRRRERRRRPSATSSRTLGKGLPPVDAIVPGLYDVFVFDAHDPAQAHEGLLRRSPARRSMPPKWALGYMQSHRTLEDETQMLGIIDTFRAKQIPLDAVIYLGTGFTPRGWNTRQPSFDFNPDVFKRDPKAVLADMHAQNVKVVVHMVPWDRDKLPTLHGTIPPQPGETLDDVAHPELLAAARAARRSRRRRVLAGRGRLVQPLRADQAASALLPGAPVDARRTCGRGACSATATPASRSGAAGCGRATPRRRGRRSRRRSPSASTTRSASARTGAPTSAASIRTAS